MKDATEWGAYHLANNRLSYNPFRQENFALVVTGLENLPRVGAVAIGEDEDGYNIYDPADLITNGQKEIIIGLRDCGVPSVQLDTLTINRQNSKIYFAGRPTFQNISFTAYDYIEQDIKDVLLAWQNQAYNTSLDFIEDAKIYKKDCTLYQMDPSSRVKRYWEIKGAWLSSVKPSDFSMNNGNEMTVSCTMVYDWAEMHRPDDIADARV